MWINQDYCSPENFSAPRVEGVILWKFLFPSFKMLLQSRSSAITELCSTGFPEVTVSTKNAQEHYFAPGKYHSVSILAFTFFFYLFRSKNPKFWHQICSLNAFLLNDLLQVRNFRKEIPGIVFWQNRESWILGKSLPVVMAGVGQNICVG